MIREFTEEDLDCVLKIWLSASVEAHDFVEPLFWHQRVDEMRNKYLPNSDTFVYERAGRVLGFYSLVNTNLAALFVDPQAQGDGIGMRLITDAKEKSQALSLSVYKHNCRAIGFYHRCGFSIVDESLDPHTGHIQLTMSS
ncbi:N-acetyltransferase [Vibrio barjaei]|uniref:N-acetyltransferase n=1 Tax=Vibrio barjaei TaxID=1676683 RepID=UPI0007BAFD73|nr:N-acetyltransferase [Vibrio barjaei]MCY9871029.1 N-acetyltransferase [Vibrio barjaei]OIN24352.1 GNAT family N-acetyltransferase [Vibrio barjaei]